MACLLAAILFLMRISDSLTLNGSYQWCQGGFELPNYYQNGMIFQAERRSSFWGFSKIITDHCKVKVVFICNGYQEEKVAIIEAGMRYAFGFIYGDYS